MPEMYESMRLVLHCFLEVVSEAQFCDPSHLETQFPKTLPYALEGMLARWVLPHGRPANLIRKRLTTAITDDLRPNMSTKGYV